MGIESWLFVVSILCFLVAIFAAIMVVKLGQNGYGNGYAQGYQNGANEKYNEVYNKRLLRQARRLTREEKKNEPTTSTEVGPGELQGRIESGSSESDGGKDGVLFNDADAGPGAEPSDE